MEPGPVCRLGNRPRMLICYLCGREYGSKSLSIHIPQCQKKWLMEEEKRPKNERRALPPQPNAEKAIGSGGARAFESFNVEAYAAFGQTLEQCPNCQRRFLPKPFKTHQKGCTAAKPAKPAGTGLIKYSLTNRLVPGAVAGSMHGKANGSHGSNHVSPRPLKASPQISSDQSLPHEIKDHAEETSTACNTGSQSHNRSRLHLMSSSKQKPPLPLRLCRPPPKSKPKLKSTQRPSWTGAGGSPFDEMEDNQLPVVRHKPSAQEWCLQAETNFSASRKGANPRLHKNSQPGSRNSFQNRHGIIGSAPGSVESGGDNATLVTAFGEIWRTHSRENTNLPMPRTHPNHKSSTKLTTAAAAREWFVPAAETPSSASANPARQIKSTNAFRSSSQVPMPTASRRQSSVNALRSSHVERALEFVSLANNNNNNDSNNNNNNKTLPVPVSKQPAGGTLSVQGGATRGDLQRHHRRSAGFY